MCASAKGILMPVSSKFSPSPDLFTTSVTLFVTGFTIICKLAPAFTWNVRLVDMKMSAPVTRCWRNPVVWRGEGTKAWYWHWSQTAAWATTCGHQGSNITCSPLRTKNQFGEQQRAGPGTAITQIMWVWPETLENASARAQYLVMMVSRVSSLHWDNTENKIQSGGWSESCHSVHIITSLQRQYR